MPYYIPIIFVLLSLYAGLVWGTYEKFKQNKIKINKLQLIIFPALIFGFHILSLFKNIATGQWRRFKIICNRMVNYPIFLGEFIEIILEQEAHNLSVKHRSKELTDSKLKKEKKQTRAVDLNHEFIINFIKILSSIALKLKGETKIAR